MTFVLNVFTFVEHSFHNQYIWISKIETYMSRLKIILIFFLIIFVECTSNDTVYLGTVIYISRTPTYKPSDPLYFLPHFAFPELLDLSYEPEKGRTLTSTYHF